MGGVVPVDRGAVHVSFGEANDLASFQVNGGKDDHGARA